MKEDLMLMIPTLIQLLAFVFFAVATVAKSARVDLVSLGLALLTLSFLLARVSTT
jgi:hypothetical protein